MASSMVNCSGALAILLVIGAALIVDPVVAGRSLDCGKSLTKECGDTIGRRVAANRGPPPTDKCCAALVQIGMACHDAYTVAHIKAHDYKGKTYPVVKRSDELWHECVAVTRFTSA